MTDLKPCPFCGGDAVGYIGRWHAKGVPCIQHNPDLGCALFNASPMPVPFRCTEEEWNRRPLEDAVRKVCEVLRRRAEECAIGGSAPSIADLMDVAADLERAMEGK